MKTKKNHKYLGLLMAAITGLAGCTEERPYEETGKADTFLRSAAAFCNQEDTYLYVPSTVEASRTTGATRPHWMGGEKLVKLVCSENAINVVELDSEGKFSDNPTNLLPVLTIPASYRLYRCATDANGDCTNVEEEAGEDVSWKDKPHIVIQPGDMTVEAFSWLPGQITDLLQPGCLTPTNAEMVYSEISPEAINIQIERSYQAGFECAGPIKELKDLGYKVRHHYSLVKLKEIADPNYEGLSYTRGDETTFGFFNTRTSKLDVDNNDIDGNQKMLINRFSPNKEIVYHMNDTFLKPGNEVLIEATQEAVNNINQSFAIAGSDVRIKLEMPKAGVMGGDIRINSIILEDDPLAMNVIGYGPSAANPLTGEIVHARTVMYLGTIKKFLKGTYDELVLEKLQQRAEQAQRDNVSEETQTGEPATINMPEMRTADMHKGMSQSLMNYAAKMRNSKASSGNAHASNHKPKKTMPSNKALEAHVKDATRVKLSQESLVQAFQLLKQQEHLELSIEEQELITIAKDFIFSKNAVMTTDSLGYHAELDQKINALIAQLGLKTWNQLNKDERQLVVDTVLPYVYIPVLVHEIGHNLGLRHNFGGSEDAENFYTEAEVKEMGLPRVPKYSSVMEYSATVLTELPVMGKYDVAALRFGYAEQVELTDGQIVSLEDFRSTDPSKPPMTLKPYNFCTDEHVAVNPNCNRFDEGTTFVEMAQHHIKTYEERYSQRNFRNGRADFSQFGALGYMGSISRQFGSLRRLFERYEDIKETYGLADTDPVWEELDFLKDLKQATTLAGNFFLSVVQTPDLMCAVSERTNPAQIIALVPIKQISVNAVDCFDQANVQLNEQYMVVGTAGKLFQSKKDPRSGNAFMDQIDVRGIYIDKLLAVDALTRRRSAVSSFNEFQGNFIDIADLGPSLDLGLRSVVMDQVVAPVNIRTIFGNTLTAEIPLKFYEDAKGQNGHRIIDPMHPAVSYYLGIPRGNPSFQDTVIQKLQRNMFSDEQQNDANSLYNALYVVRSSTSSGLPPEDLVSIDLGIERFYTSPKSTVAVQAVMSHNIVGILGTLAPEKIQEIVAALEAGTPAPDDATNAEKAAYEMGKEILDLYLVDGFQSTGFYTEVIRSMAN